MLVVSSLLIGAGSEGYDRLWEANFIISLKFPEIGHLTPAIWFGIISLSGNILCYFIARWARTRLDTSDPRKVAKSMLIFTALRLAFVIGFALSGSFTTGFVFVLLITMGGTVSGPMYDTWLNQNIESRARATVLSMNSQSNALGQTLGGLAVGSVGSRYTIRLALILSWLLQLPILAVLSKAANMSKQNKRKCILKMAK